MSLLATHNGQDFHVGDLIRVYQKIQEDNKTRTQVFEGTVIAIRGVDQSRTFTVRRIGAAGVAIERIFPLFSPFVERVEVRAEGHVRRSKLYYIREQTASQIADITKKRSRKNEVRSMGKSKVKKVIKAKSKKTSKKK